MTRFSTCALIPKNDLGEFGTMILLEVGPGSQEGDFTSKVKDRFQSTKLAGLFKKSSNPILSFLYISILSR